ncbi:hypothetical protein [Porphyrobacter sp. GA68]|uniref:hypothetical protein n=1 Tax=Porphyrobacter sp. GA68 TaxID=2883480 RepID=UPI001D186836|nr:hypothetical protein [Porphyrobacter sp. GA68]
MGLILLVTVGATFGLLVALLLEVRSFGDLSANVAAGAGGAVTIGGVANPVSLLEGLAANALLVAGLGALVFIAVANFVRSRA